MYSLRYHQKSQYLLRMPVSFFILNNHATWNFWWRDFWIIFTTRKLLVRLLNSFFAKESNIVYTSTEVECSDFSWNAIPVLYEYFYMQVRACFLVDLVLKEGVFFAGKALGMIMLVQLPLSILSLITIKVTRLVYYFYQCFMICHRVDGILSKYIKSKLMK